MINIKYGWIPDLPDVRDYKYETPWYYTLLAWIPVVGEIIGNKILPSKIDWRNNVSKIFNQGSLGSCVGNAWASDHQFIRNKLRKDNWEGSRLFIYYNARELENSVSYDSGVYIRDGAKAIAKWGVCPESIWPYIINEFTTKPDNNAYVEAEKSQALVYKRIENCLVDLKHVLSQGYPFVFGFSIYDSFLSETVENTGIMPVPQKGEKLIGGHAVMAVGYDNSKKAFIILNSWGPDWGDQGYFYMPYEVMTSGKYCDDFWVLKTVE